MDLFSLKVKKIRAFLVHLIGSLNFNRFLGTVKSKQNEGFKKMEFRG